MIHAARAASTYRQNDITTRSPLELVVLLYDGLLSSLSACRAASDAGDMRGRAEGIAKALAIVAELQNTLDMDSGGEVAVELDRLYAYVLSRLTDANVHRSVEPIDEVHRLFSPLRDAWAQIASQPAAGSAKERS